MVIYKIANTINNKIYIGQTIRTLKKRWNSHVCEKSGCIALNNSIQKYGKENFTIEQIDSAETLEELNEKEVYWISFYNSTNKEFGYNLRTGGSNHIVNDEVRQKMSNSHKGKKKSESHRLNIIKAVTGRKYSEEARKAMSLSHVGHKHTEERKQKISEKLKGRKFSPESIEKMKLAAKNRKKKEDSHG